MSDGGLLLLLRRSWCLYLICFKSPGKAAGELILPEREIFCSEASGSSIMKQREILQELRCTFPVTSMSVGTEVLLSTALSRTDEFFFYPPLSVVFISGEVLHCQHHHETEVISKATIEWQQFWSQGKT